VMRCGAAGGERSRQCAR